MQLNQLYSSLPDKKILNKILIGGDLNMDIHDNLINDIISRFFQSCKIISPEKSTHCICYDEDNEELDTKCTEEEYYYPFTLDWFLSRNISYSKGIDEIGKGLLQIKPFESEIILIAPSIGLLKVKI